MSVKRTDIVIVACLAFLLGVFISRYTNLVLLFSLLGVFSYLVVTNRGFRNLVTVMFLALALGNERGVLQDNGFKILRSYFGQKITVYVTSLDDAEYDDRGQLAFNADHISVNGQDLPGQMAVSGFGEFSVLRGDRVEVYGKLYPARGANQARISFANLDTVKKDVTWYNNLRRQFVKKLRDNLPEPLSSFAAGLLIGQRSTIPDQIITDLRVSGLAHIIAVSGYNLTIIVRAVMVMLKKISRYQKLILSLSVIALFLLITGFSASIVRAGIVSVLSLLAWYYGRSFRPAVLLSLSAAITVVFRPEYVWGDVGWYLSFLAFVGVMIVSPAIKMRFFAKKELKLLGKTMLETGSVLLMVVPYSLYIFGTLSFIALPANMIVVPFIPLAMALSAIASILPYQLAILAYPANLILDGILSVTHLLASVPKASVEFKIELVHMLIIYLCISLILTAMWHGTKSRQAIRDLLQ